MRKTKIDQDVAEKYQEFVSKFPQSHFFIKEIYSLAKQIRNECQQDRLSFSWLYFFSLSIKFETEYKGLTTAEIAKLEGMNPRSIQQLKTRSQDYKRFPQRYLII